MKSHKILDRKSTAEVMALTPMQEGLLFHYLKDPESDHYFEQLSLGISGPVDIGYFEQAWNDVVKVNEMMRVVFRWEKVKIPTQVVLKEHKVRFRYYDLCGDKGGGEGRKHLEKIKINDRREKFDLREVPFRVTLCKLEEGKYEVIISNHHILYDGWSNGIILKEFVGAYDRLCKGEPFVPPVKTKFKDYVRWIQTRDNDKEAGFWRDYLGGIESGTEIRIKTAGEPGGEETGAGPGKYCFTIAGERKQQLETFAQRNNITFASLLYSVWGIVLQKYNNTPDVVFGTVVSGRSARIKGIEDIVGLFINTLPLRAQFSPNEETTEFLKKIDSAVKIREEFEAASLVNIKEYAGLGGEEELFDTVMAIENYPLDARLTQVTQAQSPPALTIDSYSMEELTHYPFTVTVNYFEDSDAAVEFIYNRGLFQEEAVKRLAGHFVNILDGIERNAGKYIHEIDMLSSEEKQQLLVDFNDTGAVYPRDKTIHELFARQVEKTPDRVALVGAHELHELHEGRKLQIHITYHDLNEKADLLAEVLMEKGVLADDIVGIMLERAVEMITGILGILKAGGAYLPIDRNSPADRKKYILTDSKAKILLTASAAQVKEKTVEIIDIDKPLFSSTSTCRISSANLAYVIYTSGTTGRPKGVLVQHQGVVNMVWFHRKVFGENSRSRISQAASVVFDAMAFEVWPCLLAGACLCIAEDETRAHPQLLIEWLIRQQITISFQSTLMAQQLLDEQWPGTGAPLEVLRTAGDRLTRYPSRSYPFRFYNLYGPTEDTVWTTWTEVPVIVNPPEQISPPPIGKPTANKQVYILGPDLKLQPVGVIGELCISGDGLARGYLNNPELTAGKFVNKSFSGGPGGRFFKKAPLAAGGKLYKTGDLARWLPDGNIEFLGRIDQQVKIRGYRIELGEIESRLLLHQDINEAVVLSKVDFQGAHRYLCAYIVPVSGRELSTTQLREFLSKNLPGYMIPSYFVKLDTIPLTPNGKVDRKALPEPEITAGGKYVAPTSEIERELVKIWSEVLGIGKEKISIDDNFFELGGHSLKATALMLKIHKELDVKVSLADIFKGPTIKKLSAHIEAAVEDKFLSIKPVEKKDYYPLSSVQMRLYVLQRLDARGVGYNIPAVFALLGDVAENRLKETFTRLIHRHESLRTSFHLVNEEPVQKIREDVEFEIEYLAAKNAKDREEIKNFIRPFDLSRAPLLRVGLIHTPALTGRPSQEGMPGDKHILMVDMHHIISDGISMGILVREFMSLYADNGEKLSELILQYKDYAEWQNNEKQQEIIKQQGEYWLKEFAEEIPVLNLPMDYARPAVRSFAGDAIHVEIDKEETRILKILAFDEGATLYMVLLAVYTIVLAKLSNRDDITVGTPVAGRRHADLQRIMGMFVNTLVLRNSPRGESTFRQFLSQVKERTLAAFAHQDYPYEALVDNVSLTGDTSRNPLFDVMFVMQNIDLPELAIPGLKIKPLEYEPGTAKFDLTLQVFEAGEILSVTLEYAASLFKRETVEKFIVYFKHAVSGILNDPDRKIAELELLSEEEKRQLLFDFNDTAVGYPAHKTVHYLFEEQAVRHGDCAGVVFVEQLHITYNELNKKSNQLAHDLHSRGVGPDSITAVMVEPSPDMIAGILGILKAGGAYLPIDPGYPQERIDYMLKDSNAKILLTASADQVKVEDKVKEKVVEIIDIGKLLFSSTSTLPSICQVSPANLAYVIYTSGTTGRPKGVMIEHRNIVRLMVNDRFSFDFDHRDVWTMFHSYCFDFSVWEMYGALLYGGKLVMIPRWMARDTRQYLKILKNRQVTVLNQTPSAFYNLIDEELLSDSRGLSLRYVIFGGEALAPGKLKPWKQRYPHTRLINMFGITETTVHVTFKEITHREIEENIGNIGVPIPTLTTYIVDSHQKLLPIGAAGELCVGGDGVGRGYVNRPELTAEKFAANPYTRDERWYRSGDLARFLPDGEMVYLGRIDHQVQLRGFRIELGEIENRLLSGKHVKEAVVIAREDKKGDQYLCAYIVPDTAGAFESAAVMAEELRHHVYRALPEYMIPSFFVPLDKIPLTPNGKLDRRALPIPAVESVRDYTAPRDDVEKTLVEIWSDVLGIEREVIGIDSNFFQSGGHSIKATLLAAKIHKEFDVDLPLMEIFKTPTVRQLAARIKETGKKKYIAIEPAEKKDYYPVSSAQKRLYVLQQMDRESTAYNIPAAFILAGPLEKTKLTGIFRTLIHRHESLRTSFVVKAEEPVQWIHDDVPFEVELYSMTAEGGGTGGQETDNTEKRAAIHNSKFIIQNSFIRPFDLSRAPLLRVGLIHAPAQAGHHSQEGIPGDKHILVVDMHHIITDGASMGLFIEEFMSLYSGEKLRPLKLQYKDFSGWQNNRKGKESIKRQENYWLGEFAGEMPVLQLPTDFERPVVQGFAGNTLAFEIGIEAAKKLQTLAVPGNVTLFTVLLSIFNVFLAKISGQEDIVVGSPTAGRRHADLEQIIGMFVNTLALRNFPGGEKTVEEFLSEVGARAINAQENQEYLFEDLVERLTPDIKRDVSRNPLFDVMFVLQDVHITVIDIPPVKLTSYPYKSRISKFDLTFICEENEAEGNLYFSVEYSTKLFREETIERFIGYFKNILFSAVDKPGKKIEEIEIITEDEKKQILYDFNDTHEEYPGDKTIHELFARQVDRTPDRLAAVGQGYMNEWMHEGIHITYRELNKRANNLAHLLREKSVLVDSIVGIMVYRSIEMIIGILGILKAGGAYLPIDPEYPPERIDYMLKDSGAEILLTSSDLSNCKLSIIPSRDHLHHSSFIGTPNHSGHLAYVIYTSGSTGKPKGVMVAHPSVVNLLFYLDKRYPFRESDAYLLKTSFLFDVSVTELFGWFMGSGGGRLVILEKGAEKSPRKILDTVHRHRVTHLNFVPSMFNVFVEMLDSGEAYKLSSLRYIFLAGEKLWAELVKKFQRLDAKVLLENLYGPTEATIYASGYSLSDWNGVDDIPIGKPLGNIRLYILNGHGNLQPPGIPGELYISGAGVAPGYLNRPELTAEKFMFVFYRSYRSYRSYIYKTGDLVRWLPEGNIEFLGRIDFQVKVRGFRIELGEIENRLFSHASIKETVVTAREEAGESGEKSLCAYIVPHDINVYRESELRDYLSAELPDYMVPAYFVVLERMPLGPSGKVDRKALPEPDITGSVGRGYVPPANEMEKELVDIWAELLGVDRSRIGVQDNFFRLGGHSLKAAILAGRIHKALSVEVPIAELFKAPTVKGMCNYIKKTRESVYLSVEPVEEKEYYLLSPAQKRLYVVYRLDESSTGYNISYAVELKGDVNAGRLKDTFKKLIQRHESLRTFFEVVNDDPVQRIREDMEFEFERHTPAYGHPSQEGIIKNFIRPFDLSRAPLLRVGLMLIGVEEKKYILMVDMHHIISDGMSMDILIREFTAFYSDADAEAAGLRLRYRDYVEWQNNEKVRVVIRQQGAYWQKEFAGEIPVLDLPTDFARPAMQSFEGDMVKFGISSGHSEKLRAYALEENVTLFMLLLSLYNVLFFKLSGQEDIVIGTPASGRRHIDLSRIIGIFINTLALRNFPAGERPFCEFLKEVRERTLEAFENQDYPFEDLVDQVDVRRDTGRNPLFDVMLVLQNMDMQELQIPGLELKEYIFENRKSKFDMTLTVLEKGRELDFAVTYNTDLFNRHSIERFIGYFKRIAAEVLENPGKRAAEIDILSPDEKKQLVIDFNDTSREYPGEKTVYQLFEEQTARELDRAAVVENGLHCLTYGEFNRKANQLARLLRLKGVGADAVVGIMTHPLLEMVIGIMAALKAGGSYLPIDPKHPVERIKYMLTDSRAKFLLTQTPLIQKITGDVEAIFMDNHGVFQGEDADLEGISEPSSLLYTIYTSGSTGKPKGVLLKHENLVNYVGWFTKQAGLVERDRTVLTSSFGFDLGYTSLYSSILAGCQLHLLSEDIYLSPERLIDYMVRHTITYIKMTPSLFNTLVESSYFTETLFRSLRLVVLGGETIKVSDVKKVFQVSDKTAIMNHYGPTESTIGSIAQFIDRERIDRYAQRPTIGQPIYNTQVYIIDKHLELSPVGAAGELYIGGSGPARGYLNSPELTAERFLSVFYRSYGSYRTYFSSKKIYKTGDLARWLAGGHIEFLGRIDLQIKIRGFRLELEEVSNRLLRLRNIREAVVIADGRDSEGERRDLFLCAYIVLEKDKTFNAGEIKEALSGELPDYAVPSYFIPIDKLPLTPNGKLDRRALPKPQPVAGQETYAAPANPVEMKMSGLWCDLLEIEKIGVNDNFFTLGGHSLKAIILISRIHRAFNVSLTLAEIFKRPTIRGLAQYISGRRADPFASIQTVEAKDYYVLSPAQKRLYLLHRMDEESTGYNMPYGILLEGEVNRGRLEGAFQNLIRRHESLRTSFQLVNEEPVQRIEKDVEFEIENLAAESAKDRGEIIKSFIRPFDLSRAPLLRVGLARSEEERNLLMVDMHHIISDGISRRILIKEFTAFYAGEDASVPRLRIQYKDFSEWQAGGQKKEALVRQEAYWKRQFKDDVPVLELPTDYPRPSVQLFEGSAINFEIGSENLQVLKSLALTQGTTLYMVLLAIYYIFLSRLSNQEDILIGTPTAGRPHVDLEPIIGMFVNTLVLRNYPAGEKTYTGFLNETKERALEAFDNQDYQYEDLVEEVVVTRDASRNPLFDTMFVLQNTGTPVVEIPGLKLTPVEYESKTSKFDLLLSALESEENLRLTLEYSTRLFKKETIERFIKYIKNITTAVVRDPGLEIAEISILTEEDKNQLLHDFNNTKTEYPRNRTIHELFDQQAKQTPDNIALVGAHERIHITYHELKEKSGQLAHDLHSKGVGPGSIVGIVGDRSAEMVTGILAILKAGGAYLPVEPDYPQERIDYMLKDCGAKLLITTNNLEAPDFPLLPATGHRQPATSLAYIIYTSGTTGKPKGVMVEHRSVVRLVRNTNYLDFRENERILQTGALAFDASTFEIWGALLNGLMLCLVGKEEILIARRLRETIEKYDIGIIWLTSSLFNQMLDEGIAIFAGLRHLLTGGEALSPVHINKLRERFPGLRVTNGYGPTENTTFSTTYLIDREFTESIPIGKPISNSTAYIVDKWNNLQPVGVVGELWVGGDGVARGYLNDPELTAEKFISGFYRSYKSYRTYISKKLYKTGDLARWLPDGSIEFIGRIDHQVKIRGFRIEPGEIESRLSTHNEIKEVVVTAREDQRGAHRYLCAYFVPVSDRELQGADLRAYLSGRLPEYMIPSYFVRVERIPLTSNGKVDWRALPGPELTAGRGSMAPRNELERKLAAIWARVLGRDAAHTSQLEESIGIDNNFFELGGHSLKAARLMSGIYGELKVKVPLTEIFRTPTIRGLAWYIAEASEDKYTSIDPVEKKEYYLLSPAQKRLYILQESNRDDMSYNMPRLMVLEGEVVKSRLEDTFKKLIARHESFGTSFEMQGGEMVQRIHEDIKFEIEYFKTENKEKGVEIQNSFIRSFDLSRAPLLRVGLIEVEEKKHILVMDMHHIITDGSSMGIFVREFMALHAGEELPPLRIQYKDFSEWMNSKPMEESIKEQETYWLKEFEEEVSALRFFTDDPGLYSKLSRQVPRNLAGNRMRFELDKDASKDLKKLAKEEGVTIYMVLLTIYYVLIFKLSGLEDIVVGSVTAGRSHPDLQSVIGMFVNTLALRNHPGGEKTFREFLREVKKRALEAFENQAYPFEDLAEKAAAAGNGRRNPLFDAMFVLQNLDIPRLEIPGLTLKPYEYEKVISKFDLTLIGSEEGDQIVFTFEYRTERFKEESITQFEGFLKDITSVVLKDRNVRLKDIDLFIDLSDSELDSTLYQEVYGDFGF